MVIARDMNAWMPTGRGSAEGAPKALFDDGGERRASVPAMSDRPKEQTKDEALVRVPKQPYEIAPRETIRPERVTTAFVLDGHRIVRNVGVVRGIVVRSRSVLGNIGAGIQMLFGGNISLFTRLCEQARQEAFVVMLEHAAQLGANAVIGMRYDATEIMGGVSEVLAYGTAVVVEPDSGVYR